MLSGIYNFFMGTDEAEDEIKESKNEIKESQEEKLPISEEKKSQDSPTDLSVLMNFSRIAKNIQDQLREQLKSILDPEAFDAVLNDKIEINDKSDIPLFHYKNAVRILGELSELLRVYENLHKQFLEIQKGNGKLSQAVTAVYNRKQISELVDELFAKQTEFDETMFRINLHKIELRLPAADDFKRLLHFVLPVKDLKTELISNPIFKSLLKSGKISTLSDEDKKESIELDPKLKKIISQLHGTAERSCAILFSLAKEKELVDTAKLSIMRSVVNLELIMKRIDAFGKTDKGNIATLKFAFQARAEVMQFLANLPVAISSVKGITRDNLLETIEQFNLIFRDIIIHADKIEIDYHLKEGYLSTYNISDYSISSLTKLFNDKIESMGYQFKEEDRYPYHHALLKYRKNLLETSPKLSPLTKRLLSKKIKRVEEDLQAEHPIKPAQINEDKLVDEYSLTRVDIIDLAIQDLKEKRHFHYLSTSKTLVFEQCIAAFTYLREYLKEGSGYRLQDALEIMKENKADYFNILDAYQKVVLKQIQIIDQLIPQEEIGKVLIDFTAKRREVKLEMNDVKYDTPHHVNELNKISDQIKLLQNERCTLSYKMYAFFAGDTKSKKISLLSELVSLLNKTPNASFSTSIDCIAQNSKLRPILYLIFEGRTGLLINRWLTVEKSNEDIIAEINLEIKRLGCHPSQGITVFEAQSEKEDSLHSSLVKLKQNIINNKSILTGLSTFQTAALSKGGEKLRDKLVSWDQATCKKPSHRG